MKVQKEIFLDSEGDAWYKRNAAALQALDWSADPVCNRIAEVANGAKLSVLEIGCGEGSRLESLKRVHGHVVSGVDPSAAAVAAAGKRGVHAVQSTADKLPFDSGAFDLVVFGFCLYLCDDDDLFRIGVEADRVLKNPGWLIVLDFEAPSPRYRAYHHYAGLYSRKMDYKTMFLWHPSYTLASCSKFHHADRGWTDNPDEWVSVACLRKSSHAR